LTSAGWKNRKQLLMDYDSIAEELQDHSAYPRLCPEILNATNYQTCPWAKTVTGRDPNSDQIIVIAVTCKRWGCPYCAHRKIRRLAWLSKNAEPSRLLTVTVAGPDQEGRAGRYPDGKTAWDASAPAFTELIRYFRKTFGECEYMRVLELQQNGMPHFHAMLRSGYIPHGPALAEWKRLIGKPETRDSSNPVRKQYAGLNLKKIDKSFATFRYLVKYLTKLHKIPWTDRHVSYSRNFFKGEDVEQVEYAKMDEIAKYDQHPFVWLRERLAWETVAVLGEGKWGIGDTMPDKHLTISPESIGLPAKEREEPPIPLKQRLVPGMEAADQSDDDGLRPDGTRRKAKRRTPKQAETARQPAATDDDF
jgi:hypothetical protein